MRFEDDQVSDLARRCENVNIRVNSLIRYQDIPSFRSRNLSCRSEKKIFRTSTFLQRYTHYYKYLYYSVDCFYCPIGSSHTHQWWYDDDNNDCIHITLRVCSVRWQDRQALFLYIERMRKMTQSEVEICLIYYFILLVEIRIPNEQLNPPFNVYLSIEFGRITQ